MSKKDAYCNWKNPVFEEVWEESGHRSFLSGEYIRECTKSNLSHVLAKGLNKFPEFKYYKKNIVVLTMMEHHLFDNGSAEQRRKYGEEKGFSWKKLYDLREELIIEYKEK